jgi:hypothetical protein
MAALRTDPAADPDTIYQLLIEAHQGLSAEQSRRLDVRLNLLLANHIGEPQVIAQAIAAARQDVAPAEVDLPDDGDRDADR